MRWRRALSEAAIGGVTGAVVVLAFAAARVRGLEDLDHLGSFTVAILTIPLVALSYVLYRETERTRLENSAPRIVVTFEPNRYFGFFDVVIANVGRGVAFDISTAFSPDVVVSEEAREPTSLSANLFISPPVLKPGQETRLYIGRYNEISPELSVVTSAYKDERGKSHSDSNSIDLRIYESFGQLGPENDVAEISKHVKAIADALRKVTTTDRLRIDAYDSADRDRQLDRRNQDRRKFKARIAADTAPTSPASPSGDEGVTAQVKKSPLDGPSTGAGSSN